MLGGGCACTILPYPLVSLTYLLLFLLNYTENVTSLGRSCLTTPTRPRSLHYMPSLVPSAFPSNYLLQLITCVLIYLLSVPLSDYKAWRAGILSRWFATISKHGARRKQANICSMKEEFKNWQYFDAIHLLYQRGQYPQDSSRQPTQWTWRMWRHRSSLVWAIGILLWSPGRAPVLLKWLSIRPTDCEEKRLHPKV